MKKPVRFAVLILLALVLGYLLGPSPTKPVYQVGLPNLPDSSLALQQLVNNLEKSHRVKPDNEAKIVWYNDQIKNQTEYAIVYLHGFSASHGEGYPTHQDIAKRFGCNLYLSRLHEHGIDTIDALANFTAAGWWQSAQQAYAIGRKLGKKVILMGTSTGGSAALQLAAVYPEISGLVLISPNIAINDDKAFLLNNPWGLQIARAVVGDKSRQTDDQRPEYKKYWNTNYRLESLVQLQEYIETAMVPEVFNKVTQPVLTLAYYKSEQMQDNVVKVSAMRNMFSDLGTPPAKKKFINMPNTGDHVQGSPIKSKDVNGVELEITNWMQQVLGMTPRSSIASIDSLKN